MSRRVSMAVFFAAAVFVICGPSSMVGASISNGAELPSALEIVKQAMCRSYYQGIDGRSQAQMTITDKQGSVRKRRFTILRSNVDSEPDVCERQKYYVYMRSPADVRGMSLIVWKNVDHDDDRWLYLPKLDYVGRIAAGDKRTSFMGSDFLYEDISGRSLDEDLHELVEVTEKTFLVKNTPKDPDAVDFAYYYMLIDRESFISMEVKYYNSNDYNYRSYEALNVEEIDGFPTVTSARMSDLRNQRDTLIEFYKIAYKLDIPDKIFTERYLRKPPRNLF
jgi:hypothetical protein